MGEVAAHLQQCRLMVNTFGMGNRVDLVYKSLFDLPGLLPTGVSTDPFPTWPNSVPGTVDARIMAPALVPPSPN